MICGQDTHGGNKQHGCGKAFNWSAAAPYRATDTSHLKALKVVDERTLLEGRTHHGEYHCDVCNKQIVGLRFACIHCPCFNICEVCEPNSEHNIVRHTHTHLFQLSRSFTDTISSISIGSCVSYHWRHQGLLISRRHSSFNDEPNNIWRTQLPHRALAFHDSRWPLSIDHRLSLSLVITLYTNYHSNSILMTTSLKLDSLLGIHERSVILYSRERSISRTAISISISCFVTCKHASHRPIDIVREIIIDLSSLSIPLDRLECSRNTRSSRRPGPVRWSRWCASTTYATTSRVDRWRVLDALT